MNLLLTPKSLLPLDVELLLLLSPFQILFNIFVSRPASGKLQHRIHSIRFGRYDRLVFRFRFRFRRTMDYEKFRTGFNFNLFRTISEEFGHLFEWC